MNVDLSLLPPPEVIETLAFETILQSLKDDFLTRHPAAADVIDLESDPLVKLLETAAYRELLLRARYNDEARSLLLAFATGTNLDHIGVTYFNGTERLTVTPADNTAVPPTPAIMETDADYRLRLQLQPESESVAGPRDAFRFHAISADGQIKDAAVTSPQGGTTEVFVLTHTGSGIPGAPLLATVSAALNGESIRPLSEEVIVSAPAIVNYALSVELTLFAGPATEVVTAAVNAALFAFATDHHRLGTDIIRSAIDAAAHQSGVKKVVIVSPPADIACNEGQAPYCTGITVAIVAIET